MKLPSFRFGLRTVVVITFLIAGCWAVFSKTVMKRKYAVEALERDGVSFKFDFQYRGPGRDPNIELTPHWLRWLFSIHSFHDVVEMRAPPGFDFRGREELGVLTELKSIRMWDAQIDDLTGFGDLSEALAIYISGGNTDSSLWSLRGIESASRLNNLQIVGTRVESLHPLRDAKKLRTLIARDTRISDLQPIASLTGLFQLDVSNARVSSLAPLESHRLLKYLDLSGTKVTSLEQLPLGPLHFLNISETPIVDVAPLARHFSIEHLAADKTAIREIGPLRHMDYLTTLLLRDCPIEDLSPISKLKKLNSLALSSGHATAFPHRSQRSPLEYVEISRYPFRDLARVEGSAGLRRMSLAELPVEALNLSSATVLRLLALRRLPNLKKLPVLPPQSDLNELVVYGGPLHDIAPLHQCQKLRILSLVSTHVSDLSSLSTLTNLRSLDVRGSPVQDFTPLNSCLSLRSLTVAPGQLDANQRNALRKNFPTLQISEMVTKEPERRYWERLW